MELDYHKKIFRSDKFDAYRRLSEKIINWDFTELTGKGACAKMEHFFYIEVKIYGVLIGVNDDRNYDEIIWKVTDREIHWSLFNKVSESIMVFNDFVSAIRNKNGYRIVCEIVDGAFSFDSYRHATRVAVGLAFIDCFEKGLNNMNMERINEVKNNVDLFLRSFSSKEELMISSLYNAYLKTEIKNLFSLEELEILKKQTPKEWGEKFHEKAINYKEYFLDKDIISNKFFQLTSLGIAHLSLILGRRDILYNVKYVPKEVSNYF